MRHHQKYSATLSMLSILLLSSTTESADSRQVFSSESAPWLRAVGKLQVPGQRYRDGHRSHYMEDCSATLVSNTTQHDANIIITAWHCIELYSDLSKPILFTALTSSGERVKREALRLADGGGMHADWAILRLHRTISSQQIMTMAGYSRDSGIGDSGETLTFDPACVIYHQQRSLGDTDCMAHKGASGGAVIQLSKSAEPLMCGVISQGNGEGRSTFVPVSKFRNAINLYLK
jgi:hypothetical protein